LEVLTTLQKDSKRKHRRFYRIKKNDQARKLLPLDWHWGRVKGNIWLPPLKDRRLRQPEKEIIGTTFWRIHFHETVVWELKALCIQKEIFLEEAALEEMLSKLSPTDNPTEDLIRKHCLTEGVSQLPSVIYERHYFSL
jgi:hypothetical protein